jgi:transposase
LAKLIGKVSESLAPSYAELFERLPGEAVLNIAETGHKENGVKFCTWCLRAQLYTLFRIDKSRGSKGLVEVLDKESAGCFRTRE